jgi:hypothetical protein
MTLDASKAMCETSESQNRTNKQLNASRTFHRTLGVRDSEITIKIQQKLGKLEPLNRWLKNKTGNPPSGTLTGKIKLHNKNGALSKNRWQRQAAEASALTRCGQITGDRLPLRRIGARNKLRSTPLTLVPVSLKTNTQFVCGLCGTLLNSTQVVLNHFLTQSSFLKMCSQIGNLLLKLDVLFGSTENLTRERTTQFVRRG